MDIPHARADAQLVALVLQRSQNLHAVAGGLDGGHVGVQVGDRVDQLVELGVAHVRVDLHLVLRAGGSQAEGANGPLQVVRLLLLAQWQQLADSGLVHLHHASASGDQVVDLVAQSQSNLVGGLAQRLVVTHEGPSQHGHRAGQHALDRLVGQVSCNLVPVDGHGVRAGNVTEDDRRAHAAGAVGLHPSVLGGQVAVQLLGEVLHHVVALRLAVHQHVQAQLFLALDNVRDLVLHGLGVGCVVDLALAVLRTRLADLRGLREGADGGGRQRRQVQLCLLRLAAGLDGVAATVGVGHGILALAHGGVVGQGGVLAVLDGLTGLGEQLLVGLGLLAAQGAGQGSDLADLLGTEGQPLLHLGVQVLLALQGVRHVQQGAARGDGNRAAFLQALQGLQCCVQVGAPDVVAIHNTCGQQFLAGPGGQLGGGSTTGDQVHAEGSHTGTAQQLDGCVAVAEVGLDEEVDALIASARSLNQFLVASAGALQQILVGGRISVGEVGDQDRLVELYPLHAAVGDALEQAGVGVKNLFEVSEGIRTIDGAGQRQVRQRANQHRTNGLACAGDLVADVLEERGIVQLYAGVLG